MSFPREFPRLETRRLLLRELDESDAEAMFLNYSDEAISKYFMATPFTSRDQAERLITAFQTEFTERQAISWAITLQGDDTCLGTCSYMVESESSAEIGYDLTRVLWGRGIMSEALAAVIAYGFKALALGTIHADTLTDNVRSVNLLQRLGFRLDDVRDGSHFFSLRSDEWPMSGDEPGPA